MRIIPFASKSLAFRISTENRNMLLLDYLTLPFARRFLSQIYFFKRKLSIGGVTLPNEGIIYPEFAMLLLQKNFECLPLAVDYIDWCIERHVVMGVLPLEDTEHFLKDGIKRVKTSKFYDVKLPFLITGALIYYDNEEKYEAIEIGSGLLSVLSPKEIKEKYM